MSEVQKKDLFGVIVDRNLCFVPGILEKSSNIVLSGGCAGCPAAQMILVGLVENAIKSKVPQVKRVEAV